MAEVELRKNEEASRYEVVVDGVVAGFADYHVRPGGIGLPHTEVSPNYGGRGLGTKIVAFALDDVRALGTHAIPLCPFVASFIRNTPEYRDLVEESRRCDFDL